MAVQRNASQIVMQIIFTVFVAFIVLISFYPFIWLIFNSFKSTLEIFQSPTSIPKAWSFDVFVKAWEVGKFSTTIRNSFIVTGGVVAITLLVSSMAAFATSHLEFKGRKVILASYLGAQVVSGQILIVPLFKLLREIGLYNTHLGLILITSSFSIPMSVYLFNGFFKGIPKEIFESTKIDGCSNFNYYWKVLVPLSTPIIASVSIFQSMFSWNEYLFALTFIRTPSLRTIPPQLQNFFSQRQQEYDLIFAGLTIIVLPILILYILMQKYFIRGLTAGSIKG